MTINLIFFVCCLIFCVKTIFCHEIIFEKIENAFGDDNDFLVFDGLRVKKFNRTTHVFVGKYNLKVSLDDEYDIMVEAFNFQGGQYKKMGDKKLENFCKSLYQETVEKPYNQFYEASSFKIPFNTCPFPAGENEVNNLIVDDNGMLPPYIPGGEKWRLDVRYLKQDKVLGGFNVYAMIRNEQSLLKG